MRKILTPLEAKRRRARIRAALLSAGWFTLTGMAIMSIVFVTLWMGANASVDEKWRTCTLIAICCVIAFLGGWSANRVFKMNLDLWLAQADPLELEVAIKGAENQKQVLERMIDVTPGKELVGSSDSPRLLRKHE